MLPNKATQIEFTPLPGCQIPGGSRVLTGGSTRTYLSRIRACTIGYINANAIRGPQNQQMKYIATQVSTMGR